MPINLYLPAEAKSEPKKPEAAPASLEMWREPPGMLGVYVRRVKKQQGLPVAPK